MDEILINDHIQNRVARHLNLVSNPLLQHLVVGTGVKSFFYRISIIFIILTMGCFIQSSLHSCCIMHPVATSLWGDKGRSTIGHRVTVVCKTFNSKGYEQVERVNFDLIKAIDLSLILNKLVTHGCLVSTERARRDIYTSLIRMCKALLLFWHKIYCSFHCISRFV